MEFVKFMFDDVFHFIGFVIIVGMICATVEKIFRIIFHGRN